MTDLRSWYLYRLLHGYVLYPLWLLSFRLAARAQGLHRVRFGQLSAWGDADFLALCRSSVERLEGLDSGLHRVLTQGRRTWIFHDRMLPQAIYTFAHDVLGRFAMFIVPASRDQRVICYGAVFNRK